MTIDKQFVTMFYAGWGMRCCGDPIFIGDILNEYEVAIIDETFKGSLFFQECDFYYDNHRCFGIDDESIRFLTGKVQDIREIWQNQQTKVDQIIEVQSAGDVYHPPEKDWRLEGYLIHLEVMELHRCEHGSLVRAD